MSEKLWKKALVSEQGNPGMNNQLKQEQIAHPRQNNKLNGRHILPGRWWDVYKEMSFFHSKMSVKLKLYVDGIL